MGGLGQLTYLEGGRETCLFPSILGELHTVIGGGLVDVSVL